MAEIKKINVNGVEYDIGGGSKLYQHNIMIRYKNTPGYATVISRNSSPYTYEALRQYVYENDIDLSIQIIVIENESNTIHKINKVWATTEKLVTNVEKSVLSVNEGVFSISYSSSSYNISTSNYSDNVIEL